ncbi:MAG TPA: endonuclease [Bacilli bacterium]|nr:endonuclease [Bacilli bacterium]
MNRINTRKFFIASLAALVAFGTGVVLSTNSNLIKSEALYSPGTTYTVTSPAAYYSSINDSVTGTSLLSALQSLNSSNRKKTIGYSSMGTSSANSPYAYTDYNPNASVQYDNRGQRYSTSLVSFYTKTPMTGYNKEHVWPNSRGGGAVENDIHMPRPTISAENSNRGNSFYVEGRATSNNGWDPKTAGYSEISRGESARIIFYCMVASSNLKLADVDNITSSGAGYTTTMGKLSDMLKWNLQHGVTIYETNRNNGAQYLQGNRNPFIDHPEYACKIWGNTNTTTQNICASYGEAPNTITLSPSSSTIAVGGTVTLNVNVDSGSSEVTWSSNNTAVATVSNGVVTGRAAGTATITATSKLDNVVKGTATVTVKSISSLAVSGTPSKKTYTAGETFNPAGLTVTATYNDNSTSNVTSGVVWTPSPLTAGTTSVTGTYAGKNVTVSGITVQSNKTVTINKSNSGLPATGASSPIIKAYTVKNGTINDGTMSIKWGAGSYNYTQYDEIGLPNGVKIEPNDSTYVKTITADLYGYINSDVYANGIKITGTQGTSTINQNSKVMIYTINSSNWYIVGNTAEHNQAFYSLIFSVGEGLSEIKCV